MSKIFNQIPEALPLEVFMNQSSFGRKKLTSLCVFMFFIISTAFSGKNDFFPVSVWHIKICHRRPCSFTFSSYNFWLLFALFYQSVSSSAHLTITPHFFNRKIFWGRLVNFIIHTWIMRRSGAGVLDYPSASFASRWVPQNSGPRTLIIHVCTRCNMHNMCNIE